MPRVNRIKQCIGDGRIATGFSLCFPSVHIVEILGRLDFDFVWLDGEHGPFGLAEIERRSPTPGKEDDVVFGEVENSSVAR